MCRTSCEVPRRKKNDIKKTKRGSFTPRTNSAPVEEPRALEAIFKDYLRLDYSS